MTIGESFRQALDGLMRAKKRKAAHLAKQTGISPATFTKLLSGERGASFELLEKLRVALGVTAAELFTPRYVTVSGREFDISDELAHTPNAGVRSALPQPSLEGGGPQMTHPDHQLLTAVLAYWDTMTRQDRINLVVHLSQVSEAAPPNTAGFGHG